MISKTNILFIADEFKLCNFYKISSSDTHDMAVIIVQGALIYDPFYVSFRGFEKFSLESFQNLTKEVISEKKKHRVDFLNLYFIDIDEHYMDKIVNFEAIMRDRLSM